MKARQTGDSQIGTERSAKSVFLRTALPILLHATGNAGKHIVRVTADQTDRADDYDENYGKHDRIFRNVLTLLARPKGTWVSQQV